MRSGPNVVNEIKEIKESWYVSDACKGDSETVGHSRESSFLQMYHPSQS